MDTVDKADPYTQSIAGTGEAIERGYQATSEEFKENAAKVVEWLSDEFPFYTSDHVVELYEKRYGCVPDRRAFGGVMVRARNAGLIERGSYETLPYPREGSHARPRNVWKSLVYKGPNAHDVPL